MGTKTGFSILDYVIFVATVLCSFLIGLFFALWERKKNHNNPEEYFLAGRRSRLLPVTLSFIVTFQSSIIMLGFPAEVYLYGAIYVYYMISIVIAFTFTAFFIVPVFYPLKLTTVYEYLNLRYGNNELRYVTMAMGIFYNVFYMSTVTYGTCVALDVVMGLPYWATIVIYTSVTTIYTSIGGIKAVIWTDVFQFVIMTTGILAVIIKGIIEVGGIAQVQKYSESRLNFNQFGLDPRIRYTFWNLGVTSVPMWLYTSYMQPAMQRVYSTPDVTTARNMYLISAPVYILICIGTIFEGLVIFAYYTSKGCDIYNSGVINNINQLVPYTVLELFGDLPGLPGLFIAALSSAAFSTLSSCLSSLSAIAYEDILKVRNPNVSSQVATNISRLVTVLFGVIALAVTFLISTLPGSIISLFSSFVACMDGPTCAIFMLSAFSRRVTTKGVLFGAMCGMSISLWLNLGKLFSDIPADIPLPAGPTDSCSITSNLTSLNSLTPNEYSTVTYMPHEETSTAFVHATHSLSGLQELYRVSYMYYSFIGFTISFVVGFLASLCCEAPKRVDNRCLFAFRKHVLGKQSDTMNEETIAKENEEEALM
ncbi:sodium-coupled monocarboxylate transporter 2-like [Mya arenaria]|uniref:sodium-coupled monocarboxylate transporter 2-like n=1 Tax=Mya arenaria TaxID=6604 RepID=UPI0022E1EF9E|nr:sodium-coupled monocarboxylate transporter 2-like [Mya arenaria]